MAIACQLFFILSSALTATSYACTEAWQSCGDSNGFDCCTDGYYCMPWDSNFYQCMDTPPSCPEQETNVDYYGNDIKTIYQILPSECCTQCAATDGCVAYTFVNTDSDGPACYLKSSADGATEKVGAVSGKLDTSGSGNTCETPKYDSCGTSGERTCCPDDFYCQPWNPGFAQCIPTPGKCSNQETDVDYHGNDIKTVYVSHPNDCCDECAKTEGCKTYTYINSNPGQPACYLKSKAGDPEVYVGAVSGTLD